MNRLDHLDKQDHVVSEDDILYLIDIARAAQQVMELWREGDGLISTSNDEERKLKKLLEEQV